MHIYRSKIASLLIISSLIIISSISPIFAGGGRIDMSSTDGVVNGTAAQVKATIYNEERTQLSPGEQGSFSFENPTNGQTCTTPNQTSNSQGEITGSCTSSTTGQFVIVLKLTNGDERTVAVSFNNPPTPTPVPQNLSGSYTLELSASNISFTNEHNTGYGVGATLRDKNSREVIINQSEIEYVWVTNNPNIVQILEIKAMCIGGVLPPCPRVNAQLEGYNSGSTSLTVTAKKGGQTVGTASVNITINQASQNPRRGTAATPTPVASSSLTPTSVKPSPTITPKVTVQATPSASVTETITLTNTTFETVENSPAPSSQPANAPAAGKSKKTSFPWEVVSLGVGILLGIGLPVGWFFLENHPAQKMKLIHQWHNLVRKIKPSQP